MIEDCVTSATATGVYQQMEKDHVNTRDLAMSCTIGFFTAKKNFTKSVGIAAGIAYLGNNGSGVAGASTAAAKAVDLMLGKAYSFIKSPLLSFATGAAGEAVGDKTTNNINDK
ncbi:hypothetical protein CC658_03970 [Salmonella enterica subsp. enterica serovar Koketime]|nr:hypothetical protein [Salmonella enterica subsp. enterica serovar Koketime]EAM8929913.1 hypothetical protein [Salmonella enterica]EBR9059242.1 hypothetical protein [Salmonella enterica subsp. enterica serovar Koketime]EBV0082630.1 hypothetical protein [Salmonella enterica subsp. enterica serovar Koketime]EBW1482170.1 hypothetical protein [Salmonella enterica subsp. enterica serovar Koketime]